MNETTVASEEEKHKEERTTTGDECGATKAKENSGSQQKVGAQNAQKVEEMAEEYDHLHQLFITKNPVLCHEVERNFNKLTHSYPQYLLERIQVENAPLPTRFQHAHPAAFPYFLTLREFLVLLGIFPSISM